MYDIASVACHVNHGCSTTTYQPTFFVLRGLATPSSKVLACSGNVVNIEKTGALVIFTINVFCYNHGCSITSILLENECRQTVVCEFRFQVEWRRMSVPGLAVHHIQVTSVFK